VFAGLEQQVHERHRLSACSGCLRRRGSRSRKALVAEQLFELIDDDQQVLPCVEMGLFDRIDEAELAHAQRRLHHLGRREAGVLVRRHTEDARLRQRPGQRTQRPVAGAQRRDPP
jgi:hypothetical protein